MSWERPELLWFLLLVPPLVLLLRRRRGLLRQVSGTAYLWAQVLKTQPRRRFALPRARAVLIPLAATALVLAAAGPVPVAAPTGLTLVIDTSASMGWRGPDGRTPLDHAVTAARSATRGTPPDRMLVLAAGTRPKVLAQDAESVLPDLKTTDGPADLEAAVALALALRPEAPCLVYTDRPWFSKERRVQVQTMENNTRAGATIAGVSLARDPASPERWEVAAEVAGQEPGLAVRVGLREGDRPLALRTLTLGPEGAIARFTGRGLEGKELLLSVETADRLILHPLRLLACPVHAVRAETALPSALAAALSVWPWLSTDERAPFVLRVAHGRAVSPAAGEATLWVDPVEAPAGYELAAPAEHLLAARSAAAPALSETLLGVPVGRVRSLRPPAGAEVLVRDETGEALIVRRVRPDGGREVVVAVDPEHPELRDHAGWPLLVGELTAWLVGGGPQTGWSLRAGEGAGAGLSPASARLAWDPMPAPGEPSRAAVPTPHALAGFPWLCTLAAVGLALILIDGLLRRPAPSPPEETR